MVKAYRMLTRANRPLAIRRLTATLDQEGFIVLMGVTDKLWTVTTTETKPGNGEFTGWSEEVAMPGGGQMLEVAAARHSDGCWTGWGIDQERRPTRFRGADWDGDGAPWLMTRQHPPHVINAIAAGVMFSHQRMSLGVHYGMQAFAVREDYALLTARQENWRHPMEMAGVQAAFPAPNGSQYDKPWSDWTLCEGAPKAFAVTVVPLMDGAEPGWHGGGWVWVLDRDRRVHRAVGGERQPREWSGPGWNGAPRLMSILAAKQKRGSLLLGITTDFRLTSCSESWAEGASRDPDDRWSAWSETDIPQPPVPIFGIAATADCLGRIWLFALNDRGQVMTLQQERPHGRWGTWQPTSYTGHYT